MRRVRYQYSLRDGLHAYISRTHIFKRLSYKSIAALILLAMVCGLGLPSSQIKAKLTDYTPVAGNSYNICDETSEYLTSPYTYDAPLNTSSPNYSNGSEWFDAADYEALPG